VDDADAPKPLPSLSRRAVVVAVVVLLLLVGGVVGTVLVTNRNQDAPVATVREYVDAIARGDATAANGAVDPKTFADAVDPALLTDEVLAAATERITVGNAAVEPDAKLGADVVEVRVEYSLGKTESDVVLRVERTGTTAGLLDDWRVIDPLLVPVRIETNEPTLDTASLAGVPVPVGGPSRNGFPTRPFFVYPGVYELHGDESRYLDGRPDPVVATHLEHGVRPIYTEDQTIQATMPYAAAPDLTAMLTDQVADHVVACFAGEQIGCPLRVAGNPPGSLRLDAQPTLEGLTTSQSEYRADGSTEPMLAFRAENGRLTYVDEEGDEHSEEFRITGRVVVTPADEVTVTFTADR
jgi:hypothetical protein